MFTVRLVGGSDLREGRLEVLHNGVWGGVCYNTTDAAARVVCSMFGFGYEHAFDCFNLKQV